MRHKKVLAGVLVLVAAVVLGGGLWLRWYLTPPAMPTTLEGAIETLRSPRYQRLSPEARQPYLARMEQLGQSIQGDEQARKSLMERARSDPAFRESARDAMGDMLLSKAKEYAKSPPEQRALLVNGFIGMQVMMEFNAKQRRAATTAPRLSDAERAARRAQERAEGMKWIERKVQTGNPQEQAYFAEFLKAVRKRRVEMGLPADVPPP